MERKLIRAEELEEKLLKMGFYPALVRGMLENMKPVDAVEVVRCEECKHWHKETGWCDKHSCFINTNGSFCHPWESCDWKMFDADGFCSYGEKREV